MLKYETNMDDRKVLVKRLAELTGGTPRYTRMPLCAYEVGRYTIDREGNLLVEPSEGDEEILSTLIGEGLIVDSRTLGDGAAGGDTDTSVGAEMTSEPEETTGSEETAGSEETTGTGETAGTEELSERQEPAELAETEEEPTASPGIPDDTQGQGESGLNIGVSLPIGAHDGVTLRNLVNLIYSRGSLIGKATGGIFSASEELVNALKEESCVCTKAGFLAALREFEAEHGNGLQGLVIEEDKITFTGFGEACDPDHLTAYTQLAELMNKQALSQKRIQAKTVDDTNEKYAMRIWLVRIGMGGDGFKQTRKILMENLSGHPAFRTQEDAEKARAKNIQKRDALRAAKAAAKEMDVATNEEEGPAAQPLAAGA